MSHEIMKPRGEFLFFAAATWPGLIEKGTPLKSIHQRKRVLGSWKDMFKRMIYNRLLEKGFNIYIYTYIYV